MVSCKTSKSHLATNILQQKRLATATVKHYSSSIFSSSILHGHFKVIYTRFVVIEINFSFNNTSRMQYFEFYTEHHFTPS